MSLIGESEIERYTYVFREESGAVRQYTVAIDSPRYISRPGIEPEQYPFWTEMAFRNCHQCPLHDATHCPVATRLAKPLEIFGDMASFTPVEVTVYSPNRVYYKKTDAQDGLRSLFGLLMATSGCPSMEPFRALARYHLPFASMDETLMRTLSMYLLRAYFRRQEGESENFSVEGVRDLYEKMAEVNQQTVARIKQACQQDSALNAVVMLDSTSQLFSFDLRGQMQGLAQQFGG